MRFFALTVAFLAVAFPSSTPAAGKQLTGQYAPAATPPLSPSDAQKKFSVPPGFEVRLFAAEPDVINPVAMTWDDRGRLWVVELFEYPLGAPTGAKPRDRIKILEDTDGDGRADKVTIFADGLNLATGILLGNGGAYVGQAPHLLFLEDTNGDDIADKRTILKTGFGLEDRHELLNGFTWGPDGWMYMTHGVFTRSKVKDPDKPEDGGVLLTAGVARFHPRTKKFEIFSEGTSNPWGVDFDREGNAFVSACVIDHMFHMAPGGIYTRQAGNPPFPYAYELLPSIVDHKHFRAAYAGAQVYQGNQFPPEYLGTIFIGNIHDSAVHQDRLTPVGSTFKSSSIKDFVRANDGWFRPVSSQVGPDGALWIMDWYDKYPCYQNANADPEGVDRERGRVWRVVYTGDKPGAPVNSHSAALNLGKATSQELVRTLSHANIWQRRMAQRLLSERRDPAAKSPLEKLVRDEGPLESRLAGLWTLHTAEQLEEGLLDDLVKDKEPGIRMWVARLTGERQASSDTALARLNQLAHDPENTVRTGVATALRQFVSGSLTIDTTPSTKAPNPKVVEALATLASQPNSGTDPLLSFMIWMASEPIVANDFKGALNRVVDSARGDSILAAQLVRKMMRRICDTGERANVDLVVDFLDRLHGTSESLVMAALDGLIEGQKGRALLPLKSATEVLAKLNQSSNAPLVASAQQLGTIWGDSKALNAVLAVIQNRDSKLDDRIQAVQAAKLQKTDLVRDTLLKVLPRNNPEALTQEIIRALNETGTDEVGAAILQNWKLYPEATRRSAAQAMASRRNWARLLLDAIQAKSISAADIPVPVIRSLSQSGDESVRVLVAKVIGRVREADVDKLKLIAAKKQVVLNGPVDLRAGHAIAQKTCFTCHKLYGEGADVGPDLTGVGRSSLDALLTNVIDPNQIIGAGYENVEVETKDGRTVSGRLVEDTDTRVRILSAGPKEEIIAKSDVAAKRISQISVMPEGLEQMPDSDFRNLISYILNPPQDKP